MVHDNLLNLLFEVNESLCCFSGSQIIQTTFYQYNTYLDFVDKLSDIIN